MKKIRVGILGATGMVGQRFVTLLKNHPWFDVAVLAASPRSAGKTYLEAVEGRWKIEPSLPESVADILVEDVANVASIAPRVDLVFSALDLDSAAIRDLENAYAGSGVAVVSNNSAHRWTTDVPLILPEVNPDHLELIKVQRRNRGWDKGLIVVKPNCSLQSYVPVLAALHDYQPERVFVTTFQAISGSGKRLNECPEIMGNVIPLKGEEEKSEQEPLKILGTLGALGIENVEGLKISAHCNRVPVEDGHLAAVSVGFREKPPLETLRRVLAEWQPEPQRLLLPSAPQPFITLLDGEDRPQSRLDNMVGKGMGLAVGRLRECPVLDVRFMVLSHNTIRGAAGGAILTAELLYSKGYLS
jgi:aspartate-semialdehyde dehydrogenase